LGGIRNYPYHDLLLVLYTYFSPDTNFLLQTIESVAQRAKTDFPNTVIAKIDCFKNDLDDINVPTLPAILYYKKTKNSKQVSEPLVYTGE
jgi:hypothetical protein